MYCKKCGNFIPDGSGHCPRCGNAVTPSRESAPVRTACKSCGNILSDCDTFCPRCGNPVYPVKKDDAGKFLPSFILGLIASIFGMGGGLCVTMIDSFGGSGVAPFLLIFGGSIVGLVGACKCLTDVKKGSILELIAALLIIICAFGITGGDIGTVLALLLFAVGGAVGFIHSVTKK